MRLFVGFDSGQMERNAEAEAIWRSFVESVTPPFQYATVVHCAYHGPINGVAAATFVHRGHPDFRDEEYARILLTDRFARMAADDGRRVLTLLHESLHLVGFTEHLRKMDEQKWALIKRHDGSPALELANALAGQLFEADAEFMLVERYPERATQRANYYLDLQLESIAKQGWTNRPKALQPYELVGHRLRLELALLLVRELKSSRKIVETLGLVDQELGRRVLDGDPETWRRLETLNQLLSPSRPDFARITHWGPDAYRRAVELVIEAGAHG